MKKPKLIRLRICPDVRAEATSIEGRWHDAWCKPESEVSAFFVRGRGWVRCEPTPEGSQLVYGYKTKEEALA